MAWRCAAAAYEEGKVSGINGITFDVLKYVKPSVGGSVKAALVALVDQSTLSVESPHLPVQVIAIRGSKSIVDFMVNANVNCEDPRALFVRGC